MNNLTLKNGSTLIIALWSLMLLTTFALELGLIVRQKISLVHRLENRDNLLRIADAGVRYAITELRKADALYVADFLAEHWSDQQDIFEDKRVGDGKFTISYNYPDGESSRLMYGMQDEESKINLNEVDVKVIKRLLESTAGLTPKKAEELAFNIVDWRDKDSFFQHPQYGAEDSDYKHKRYAYEAKDSDYEVIEELLLVEHMSQEVFDNIKNYVTVHGNGKVNINTAPRSVLVAIGLEEYVVDNILIFRKGGDQIIGTGDDDIFIQTTTITSRLSQTFSLSPSELGSLSNLVASGAFVTKSENFMIRSSGTLNNKKGKTTIVAVVDRTGQIKYWREEA